MNVNDWPWKIIIMHWMLLYNAHVLKIETTLLLLYTTIYLTLNLQQAPSLVNVLLNITIVLKTQFLQRLVLTTVVSLTHVSVLISHVQYWWSAIKRFRQYHNTEKVDIQDVVVLNTILKVCSKYLWSIIIMINNKC